LNRQGYDLQLTKYDARGWRATFYVTGSEHSITADAASAWEQTPWLSKTFVKTQKAALGCCRVLQ
jgi:hypothetical protein